MTRVLSSRIVLAVMLAFTLLSLSCKPKAVAVQPPPPPPPPPPPAPPAPAITLRADRNTIDRGQSVTLTWDARNSASVRIEPEVGTVTSTGNRQVSPASSVTYTATATGPGGTATDAARITVNVPAPPAAVV